MEKCARVLPLKAFSERATLELLSDFKFYLRRCRKSETLEGPLEFKIDHIPVCMFVLLQYLISEKYYII